MNQAKLIGLPARDTPPELKTAAGHRRQFPPDLLRQASKRLQILSLVGAGLWILGPSLAHLALYLSSPENPRWAQFGASEIICSIGVLISLGLYVFLRGGRRDPVRVMNLALVYMVGCAALIGLMMHWEPA